MRSVAMCGGSKRLTSTWPLTAGIEIIPFSKGMCSLARCSWWWYNQVACSSIGASRDGLPYVGARLLMPCPLAPRVGPGALVGTDAEAPVPAVSAGGHTPICRSCARRRESLIPRGIEGSPTLIMSVAHLGCLHSRRICFCRGDLSSEWWAQVEARFIHSTAPQLPGVCANFETFL